MKYLSNIPNKTTRNSYIIYMMKFKVILLGIVISIKW